MVKAASSSDIAISHLVTSSLSQGVAYQNASTQYNSLGDTAPRTPSKIPDNVENTHMQFATREAPITTVDEEATASNVNTLTSSEQSPITKRRQFRETVEADSATATAQTYPPKRPKSSKATPKMLPVRYELCEVEDMVILIAGMISELIETNDNLPLKDGVLTRFHSRTPPGISVIDYLQRLAKHATLSPPLLLSMVYYIDRLCSLYPAFTITSLTVHRFLITAATVAAKGLSDSFWNNSTYARVGGIKIAELGLLELEFLYRLDWRIVPNPEVLVDYYRGLIARTDDYTLASDTELLNPEEVAEENQTTKVENVSSHTATTEGWNKFMKDVTENSGNKDAERGNP